MRISEHVVWIPVSTPTLFPATTTNVYVVHANGKGYLIDAGYNDPDSTSKIIESLHDEHIQPQGIILTHFHKDHSAGVPALQEILQCPVLAHRLDVALLQQQETPIQVDIELQDQETLDLSDLTLQIIHAPGHTPGHIHLYLANEERIFTGDNVVGEGTTWIGPPEGDLRLYLHTLEQLRAMTWVQHLAPGHGPMIDNPAESIDFIINRRLQREQQIVDSLAHHSALTVKELVTYIYQNQIHHSVFPVAEKTILGHLLKLLGESRVSQQGDKWSLL